MFAFDRNLNNMPSYFPLCVCLCVCVCVCVCVCACVDMHSSRLFWRGLITALKRPSLTSFCDKWLKIAASWDYIIHVGFRMCQNLYSLCVWVRLCVCARYEHDPEMGIQGLCWNYITFIPAVGFYLLPFSYNLVSVHTDQPRAINIAQAWMIHGTTNWY